MSTKTTIKRIALVAAVAAAFGGLSTVAANATVSGSFSNSISAGSAGAITGSAGAYAASPVVGTYLPLVANFGTDTNNADLISSTGVGSINVPSIAYAGATIAATAGVSSTSATAFAAAAVNTVPGSASTALNNLSLTFSAYSATAGTQTISFTGSSGTATLTITWGAAPVVTAQYSTAYLNTVEVGSAWNASDSGTVTTDAATTSVVDTAGSQVAELHVVFNSAAGTPIANQPITVAVAGPGTVGVSAAATTYNTPSAGKNLTVAAASGVSAFDIAIWADGTAGTSTITISSGTTVVATKTLTFTGTPAKATAVQGLYVLKAGGTTPGTGAGAAVSTTADAGTSVATTSALTATLVDANGNGANGTVKIVSSNSAVATAGSCDQVTATPGEYQCDVQGASGALSGQTATITFEAQDSSGNYTILAAPLTYTIGGAVAKEALSLDSTSYSALQPLKLTVTATDSSGNKAYDADETLVASLVSSTQLGGTGLVSPAHLVNGVGSTATGANYAPSVAGSFTISGTDNLSSAGEAVSVTGSSVGGSSDAQASAATDAANEATDAANAATDAANAAADAADAATSAAQDAGAKADAALAAVTALSAKITVLAAQIAKIVKKLKA